jgi:pimeloyl-ACP methyl ester carboxylesterase
MNPLFFGSADAPLYGVYHAPQATPRDAGVVLCPPFGQEYMRAHRALRQLALQLNRLGYHVLRFDYRGTGDSSGDMIGVEVDDWLADIGFAIDELRDLAGIRQVSLIGLRLGALFAAVACHRRADIQRLVAWDPLASGQAYESELLAELTAISAEGAASGKGYADNAGIHFNGFELPAHFLSGLRDLDLTLMPPRGASRTLLAISHDDVGFAAIDAVWQLLPGYRRELVPAPHDWNFVDNFGSILLPMPVINAIAGWME